MSEPAAGLQGPLKGLRVVELVGIGPAPFACTMLADAGADVIRIDRPASGSAGEATGAGVYTSGRAERGPHWDVLGRSRLSAGVNLKTPEGRGLVLDLVEQADVLVEGFRPGVTERLGLGPDDCLARNPRLVYGRMTGWGQEGPMAEMAGHDIDYIALAGALWPLGRAGQPPVPPLNLVGDFGGGGMLLAFGVLAAVIEAARSGQGQVVDAAMVDGSASLNLMLYAFYRLGIWRPERGSNVLDTGAHFYEVYETADGQYIAVGAIEPPFYAALLQGLSLDPAELPDQNDRSTWPAMKVRFAELFAMKSRDEWVAIFAGTDACVAPVLSPLEAQHHPHNQARGTFLELEGILQPAPSPRFSRTPGAVQRPPSPPGADTDEALAAWGIDAATRDRLRQAGALG